VFLDSTASVVIVVVVVVDISAFVFVAFANVYRRVVEEWRERPRETPNVVSKAATRREPAAGRGWWWEVERVGRHVSERDADGEGARGRAWW
jgi:hypothetical protein